MAKTTYTSFTVEEVINALGLSMIKENETAVAIAEGMINGTLRPNKVELNMLSRYKGVSVPFMLAHDDKLCVYRLKQDVSMRNFTKRVAGMKLSDEMVAEICGVTLKFVEDIRKEF